MGKRDRRRQRDSTADRPSTTTRRRDAVHMTVAAVTSIDALDLRHETQLVKAALLYADNVTLASPKVLMLASLAAFGAADRRARIDGMAELIGLLEQGQEATELYQQLRKRRTRLSPQERRMLVMLERHLEASGEELAAQVDAMLEQAGADELGRALEEGLVTIHGLGSDGADEETFLDVAVERMADLLAESVSTSAQTFPLFDDEAGDLLRAMVAEGKVADPHRPRAAEAGIAGRLIGQLEAFPDADMDVVLDVRRRLQTPLIRFRAALAAASSQFATAAWDEAFAREVDDLFRREVAALLEVREALDELGARPTLLRAAGRKETVGAVGAALALAAAGGIALMDLPALIYGTPGVGIAVSAAAETAERRAARQEASRNAFYFLYRAETELNSE
jgi:hypothetical protein